jgi:hypothetical protein
MPAFPARDLPTAVLLAQDDLSTRLTVLTLNCWQNSEATSRVLMLLEDLSAVDEECEGELGTYAPLNAPVPRLVVAQPLRF